MTVPAEAALEKGAKTDRGKGAQKERRYGPQDKDPPSDRLFGVVEEYGDGQIDAETAKRSKRGLCGKSNQPRDDIGMANGKRQTRARSDQITLSHMLQEWGVFFRR